MLFFAAAVGFTAVMLLILAGSGAGGVVVSDPEKQFVNYYNAVIVIAAIVG